MNTPIRTANLQILVNEFGSVETVADLSGVSDSYLNEILRGGKLPSGALRNVGNNVARKLEDGCGKAFPWMDTPHDAAPAQQDVISPEERELLIRFRKAGNDLRKAILTVARLTQ